MKMTESRLNMLVDATANLLIEKARKKEEMASPYEGISSCLLELMGNTQMSLTVPEILEIKDNHEDTIMHTVMDIAHKENPSHDCKTCVLLYVCNPDENAREDLLGTLLAALMDTGDNKETKGDC